MTTTTIGGILYIHKEAELKKQGRKRPYYRVDAKLDGERMAKTVSIASGDDGEAWSEICRFRAKTMGFKRTPTTWLQADPMRPRADQLAKKKPMLAMH